MKTQRPRVLQAVGAAAPAGTEVHSLPSYTELSPGVWENDAGGITYGRYFIPDDICQWNIELCFQGDDGTWYCRADGFTPPATVTGNSSQPQDQTPSIIPNPPADVPKTETPTTSEPKAESANWIWILLLALYLISRKDK